MTIWERYDRDSRDKYVNFLQVYGALSNAFRQKHGNPIPYLDSKFQETIYARVFNSENVDIGNTPHDILSIFGDERIGIGLKTWMSSDPSYQKVMQLKKYKKDIDKFTGNPYEMVYRIAEIKNSRMIQDYKRLGLSKESNIYHYITRDDGKFTIQESSYPIIDLEKIVIKGSNDKSITFSDGMKEYRYTFGDSQIMMKFSTGKPDSTVVKQFDVNIMDDPFDFLMNAYAEIGQDFGDQQIGLEEAYLPLYSYKTGEVPEKSGLNAWNAAPKNKDSNSPRPLNEIYIPIPREFHQQNPDFFVKDIFEYEKHHKSIQFTLVLPNGIAMPARITQDGMKALESGSNDPLLRKPDGSRWGQADLGQWMLIDVLGLHERKLVTREWLEERGVDSVRLWHDRNNHSRIYIDFAEHGSFNRFIGE